MELTSEETAGEREATERKEGGSHLRPNYKPNSIITPTLTLTLVILGLAISLRPCFYNETCVHLVRPQSVSYYGGV